MSAKILVMEDILKGSLSD